MVLRSWRILALVLLLASACPPPRVTNALIAATHRHDPSEAGKTVQSRARNRINSPILVDSRRTVAGLASGRPRQDSSSRPFDRTADRPIIVRPSSPPSGPRALLRLRC